MTLSASPSPRPHASFTAALRGQRPKQFRRHSPEDEPHSLAVVVVVADARVDRLPPYLRLYLDLHDKSPLGIVRMCEQWYLHHARALPNHPLDDEEVAAAAVGGEPSFRHHAKVSLLQLLRKLLNLRRCIDIVSRHEGKQRPLNDSDTKCWICSAS